MLMPASSEFVKLCRSQVAIAVSLGAKFSAVYLTQELVEGSEAKLVPIAVYPEISRRIGRKSGVEVAIFRKLDSETGAATAGAAGSSCGRINGGGDRTRGAWG
jgi:histidine kinase (EC 2.7.13.3)